MKSNYLSTLLVSFLGLLFSCKQKEVNGPLFKYNSNGQLDYIITSADTMNSDRIYFYPTGEFHGFEKYKNGKRHGEASFFYLSGRAKSHWIWYEGHPDGYCYNYGDTYEGYPMELLVYGGRGQLVLRQRRDSTGKLISTEGEIPKDWHK